MKYSSLDTIVKSSLMNKGYTLHWYLPFLKYASDCLRELAMDDLRIVNSSVLSLNSYKAVTIPDGAIDVVSVGVRRGQYVRPVFRSESLNPNYNYDNHGNPQVYPSGLSSNLNLSLYGLPVTDFYLNQFNSKGEFMGGIYGLRSDGTPNIFQVFKERNEIQFDVDFTHKNVVVDWVSDGRTADSASQVNTYAEKTIEDYIDWQNLEHNRSVGLSEKERKFNKYVGSRTVFRGRMNELTDDDILASMRNNYTATIKT